MQENSERYIDLFCQMLSSENLKCTSVRQNILRVFFLKKHMSADVIMQELQEQFLEYSSKQTIYTTLKLLLSYNIISRNIYEGVSHYELIRSSNHFHLICSSCEEYQEFTDEQLATLSSNIAIKNKFKTNNLDVRIYGICKKCSILAN